MATTSLIPAAGDLRVGLVLRDGELRRSSIELAAVTRSAFAAGIDHLTVGDHTTAPTSGSSPPTPIPNSSRPGAMPAIVESWRATVAGWRRASRYTPVCTCTSGCAVSSAVAYGLPFERFERYCPCGRPEDIAAALRPYVEAGCRRFNIVPEAASLDAAIDAVGKLKHLLAHEVAPMRRTQR